MSQFIIDIETMGINPRAPITAIACVPFDTENLLTYDEYVERGIFLKVNWREQISNKTHLPEESTIQWWSEQSREAKNYSITPMETDLSLTHAMEKLSDYIVNSKGYNYKSSWFWSRGIAFDMPKIEFAYQVTRVKCPINFRFARDIRTMIDCFTGSIDGLYDLQNKPSNFIKHHALHDAAYDACCMAEIIKGLS